MEAPEGHAWQRWDWMLEPFSWRCGTHLHHARSGLHDLTCFFCRANMGFPAHFRRQFTSGAPWRFHPINPCQPTQEWLGIHRWLLLDLRCFAEKPLVRPSGNCWQSAHPHALFLGRCSTLKAKGPIFSAIEVRNQFSSRGVNWIIWDFLGKEQAFRFWMGPSREDMMTLEASQVMFWLNLQWSPQVWFCAGFQL